MAINVPIEEIIEYLGITPDEDCVVYCTLEDNVVKVVEIGDIQKCVDFVNDENNSPFDGEIDITSKREFAEFTERRIDQ